MTQAHRTHAAADCAEAEQPIPDDRVAVWDALDRLREAAAAHDDELPAFPVTWIAEPRSGD